MKIKIKTKKEMLKDPKVKEYNNTLLKDISESFLINSEMEKELCGKTFPVHEVRNSKHWPFSVKTRLGGHWSIPTFAVKEIIKDEN